MIQKKKEIDDDTGNRQLEKNEKMNCHFEPQTEYLVSEKCG